MPHYLTEEGFELLKNAHIEQAKSLNLKPYKNKWGYITYEGDGLDLVISENNIIVRDQNNKIDYGR